MVFFTPFTFIKLSQFYSITSPVLFNKNKKLWHQRKEDFLAFYGSVSAAYHIISKELENPPLDTIEFLDTHVCINNPH